MRIKKAFWMFAILVVAAALVFVISSRVNIATDVIMGGTDSVFVKSDNLSKPLDDYKNQNDKADKYADLVFPSLTMDEWYLILINDSNVHKDYAPEVREVGESGVYLDVRVIDRLNELLEAARKEGFEPYLSCGYMSYAAQQQAVNDEASRLESKGKYSYDEARRLASDTVAKPGTSDHQTGLAVHITDKQYEHNDYSVMDKEFFAWLDEHCAEYGFIKRYPSNKAGITGWDEPWHYRFVGKEAAEFISENGMSLEEFIAHYNYQN